MSFERQHNFVSDIWSFMEGSPSVKKVDTLPGKKASSTADNTLIVDKRTPLSSFNFLPGGEKFTDLWGRAPHTLIRVGKTGLLAVLAYGNSPSMQQDLLIPLAHNQLLTPTEVTENRLHITRASLATLYEDIPGVGEDYHVSRERHASITLYEDKVLISDEGSSNGTGYAIEENKLMPPGSPYREPNSEFSEVMGGAGFNPRDFGSLRKND